MMSYEGGEVEFRLLGPTEVTVERAVPIGSGKQRALLATLLLHANHLVTTNDLASRLWDGDQPLDARATVQIYVRRLRTALGDDRGRVIRTKPAGYAIRVAPDQLDVSHQAELL